MGRPRCRSVAYCCYTNIFLVLLQLYGCFGENNDVSYDTYIGRVDVRIDYNDFVLVTRNELTGKVAFMENHHWNWKFMNVVCRQLDLGPPNWLDKGYTWEFGSYGMSRFPGSNEGTGYEFARFPGSNKGTAYEFYCSGSEDTLTSCQCNVTRDSVTTPFLTAKCLPANSTELKLHLMRKSQYDDEGTLVTYVNGRWGPVCTSFQNLSRVFCPMIGRVHRYLNVTNNAPPVIYSDPVVNVHSCQGTEKSISLCDMDTITAKDGVSCDSSSLAYVDCKAGNTEPNKQNTTQILLPVVGVLLWLVLCMCIIRYRRMFRVREPLDHGDDNELIQEGSTPDANISTHEARLRYIRSVF